MDRIPELLGEIKRLRGALWACLVICDLRPDTTEDGPFVADEGGAPARLTRIT